MDNQTDVRGRDMIAPVEHITIDGKSYPTTFNNHAFRVAEDVYDERYGKDVGLATILRGVARGKYAATMAVFYGALIAGGSDMAWEDFDRDFRLDSIDAIRDVIQRGVERALPHTEDAPKETP